MIKYIVLAFVSIIFLFFFWNNSKKIGESVETDLQYATFSDLILDEKEAYLIKSHCKLKPPPKEQCSVKVFKSPQVTGYKHWQEMENDIKEDRYNFFQGTDSIYLATKDPNMCKDNITGNNLYEISKENLKQYEKIGHLSNQYIKHFYKDERMMYAFTYYPHTFQIKLHSEWEKINIDNGIVLSPTPQLVKDDVYYTFTDKSAREFFLCKININKLEKICISIDVDPAGMYIEDKDHYFILGKQKEKTILKKYKNGKWNIVKQFSDNKKVFPEKLYKYKDFIVVITHEAASILGTVSDIYMSYDNGKNWQHYEPSGSFLKPYEFYEDKRFMAVTGLGEIMVIDFDKYKPKKVSN